MLVERIHATVDLGPRPSRLLRIAGILATLAVPVLLITLAVRLVIFSPLLYEYGFGEYRIPRITGISLEQLLLAAQQTRDYFASNIEPLNIVVLKEGREFTLYTQREVAHMADVKVLVQAVEKLMYLSAILVAGVLALGLWRQGRTYLRTFGGVLRRGGLIAVVLMVVGGIGATVAFDALFLLFHEVSFTNDLWMLDPSRDYLIMMYPSGFFQDATLAIGGVALLLGLVCMVGGTVMAHRPGTPWVPFARRRKPTPQALLDDIEREVSNIAAWYGTTLYPESVRIGDWTAKEMLAHLVYWHRTSADAIAAIADGGAPSAPRHPADIANAAAKQAATEAQVRELTVALRLSHRRLEDSAQRVAVLDTIVRVRHDGTTWTLAEQLAQMRDHLREHLAELRQATIEGQGG